MQKDGAEGTAENFQHQEWFRVIGAKLGDYEILQYLRKTTLEEILHFCRYISLTGIQHVAEWLGL